MEPVLVVGASVGGSTAAHTLRQAGVPVVLLEKDLKRIKPCGGAVPPVAFDEFDIPQSLISRKVHRTVVYSPTGRSADVQVAGVNGSANDYVAMVCREDFDGYLRRRAVDHGAELVEGSLTQLEVMGSGVRATYRTAQGTDHTFTAHAVIGADGAYSPTARALGLPNLPRCVALQERMYLPPDKMARWEDCADLYLGHDVSPDLYGWVFPKKDHVAVGIGAGAGRTSEARILLAQLKQRIAPLLEGGEVFLREAHALPMHPRPQMAFDRVMLIGDAAGLVVGTSGEGIYWAMKSGALAAATLSESLHDPSVINLQRYQQQWWRRYRTMYAFLRFLQRWGYGSERQMEVFTDMCRDRDVQQLTFESYMHKRMTRVSWPKQMRMTGKIIRSQIRHYLPNRRPSSILHSQSVA